MARGIEKVRELIVLGDWIGSEVDFAPCSSGTGGARGSASTLAGLGGRTRTSADRRLGSGDALLAMTEIRGSFLGTGPWGRNRRRCSQDWILHIAGSRCSEHWGRRINGTWLCKRSGGSFRRFRAWISLGRTTWPRVWIALRQLPAQGSKIISDLAHLLLESAQPLFDRLFSADTPRRGILPAAAARMARWRHVAAAAAWFWQNFGRSWWLATERDRQR